MDRKFHNDLHRADLELLISKTRKNVMELANKLGKELEHYSLNLTTYWFANDNHIKKAYDAFDMERCKLSNYLRMYRRLYGVEYKD